RNFRRRRLLANKSPKSAAEGRPGRTEYRHSFGGRSLIRFAIALGPGSFGSGGRKRRCWRSRYHALRSPGEGKWGNSATCWYLRYSCHHLAIPCGVGQGNGGKAPRVRLNKLAMRRGVGQGKGGNASQPCRTTLVRRRS